MKSFLFFWFDLLLFVQNNNDVKFFIEKKIKNKIKRCPLRILGQNLIYFNGCRFSMDSH